MIKMKFIYEQTIFVYYDEKRPMTMIIIELQLVPSVGFQMPNEKLEGERIFAIL